MPRTIHYRCRPRHSKRMHRIQYDLRNISSSCGYFCIFFWMIFCAQVSFAQDVSSIKSPTKSSTKPTPESTISADEASFRASAAYIYGYPLIIMDVTKNVMTNTVEPSEKNNTAPLGQFINLRNYPKPEFRTVTAPNADTLYSFAWLDLKDQPYILHVPDEHRRYYLIALLSGWTEVFYSIGTRTTGTEAQDFLIVGPNWHGKLPADVATMTTIQSPTNMVWIYGRTYSNGKPDDMNLVHAIQDQYKLTPLNFYGKPYTPPKGSFNPNIDMNTSVPDQVKALDGATFFKRLSVLMKDNPPVTEDKPMIDNLAKLGIIPGKEFDINKVDPVIAKALIASVKIGQMKIQEHLNVAGVIRNGWKYMLKTGKYGTDYLQRALIADIALGANLPQDAVYPVTTVDSSEEQLEGSKFYRLVFPKGTLPPVNGFWSLTMYDDQYFFSPNPIKRYNLNPRSGLKADIHGTITIYIQHDSPGPEKESNWLPAPSGNFILMFRLFWPKPGVLNGTWVPPGVKKIVKI